MDIFKKPFLKQKYESLYEACVLDAKMAAASLLLRQSFVKDAERYRGSIIKLN